MHNKTTDPLISNQLIINPTIGSKAIIGVDEVGRGCLFGHMTVVALALPSDLSVPLATLNHTELAKLNDSKQLTHKQREHLFAIIARLASFAIINIDSQTIDHLNIHNATLLGMKIATQALACHHSPQAVLIDGKYKPIFDQEFSSLNNNTQAIIQGDSYHSSIACASIVAKVCRDNAMMAYAKRYPHYGLDKHKGYPTAQHKQALTQFGVLPEHRKSYAPIRLITTVATKPK